ncbi:MAG TPA: Na+/H+ antiporter subunit B [Candidatus Limnocylindrales bacterium]|jgi:multicomponent Na+:H+ antiporter subunit B|nr:Na+/H+ antiporter subunit B [Candidatus Limnocylindrales bacterium]
MRSLILMTTARLLMPLLLLFSVFLLLRGHNEPGGGFAGGLVAASAFILLAVGRDPATARATLRVEPQALIGAGLLMAVGSGLVGLAMGQPLLTGQWWTIGLPGLQFDFGTPLAFDIGVYMVVLGATLTMVLTLAEEGELQAGRGRDEEPG